MNEDRLIKLLNNCDDDLVEKEIDRLLEGVKIDMDSINKKAHQKLINNNKRIKRRKKLPYVAAACVCLLCITTVYADEISQAIKVFFNKTPIYSTIVDGDAYYLKEGYDLDSNIKLESVMVSEGKLEMELTTDLEENKLEEINIIPQNAPNTIYGIGGISGNSEKEYFISFMNKKEGNYNIKPFKDFKFIIAGNTYNVSLEKAESLDLQEKIYTCDNSTANNIKGVNIGARIIDADGKLNIQLITAFEDKELKLSRFGKPIERKVTCKTENLGKDKGTISSSTGSRTHDLYIFDEINNKYKLEIPENSKGRPVTAFETNAPKDKSLTLELPSIIAHYEKIIDSFSLNLPNEGEVTLNKEIDFTIQKAVIKKITRVSPTSAEVEIELNTDGDENIKISRFSFYSIDFKKISAEFNDDKAIIHLEFDKDIDTTNIEIAWPSFVINGDWVINIK